MGKGDSYALQASLLQNYIHNGGEMQKQYQAVHSVLKGSGELKREEVIEKVSVALNLDKVAVGKSIDKWLKEMKEAGLAENVRHAYWEF